MAETVTVNNGSSSSSIQQQRPQPQSQAHAHAQAPFQPHKGHHYNGLTTSEYGDTFHMITLCTTLAYAYMVVTHFTLFDASWQADGFCVTHRDTPFMSSHDWCLYVDTLAAIVLAGVYIALRNQQSDLVNQEFRAGVLGIFGHGLVHGMTANSIRKGVYHEENPLAYVYTSLLAQDMSAIETMLSLAALAAFWLCLIKASVPRWKPTTIAGVSLIALAGNLAIPQRFGFTYVQTVLTVLFSAGHLTRPQQEKDVYGYSYALYPMVVSLPVVLMSIVESTLCTAFVKDYLYGHLVYDGCIPLLLLLWYVLSYQDYNYDSSKNTRQSLVVEKPKAE